MSCRRWKKINSPVIATGEFFGGNMNADRPLVLFTENKNVISDAVVFLWVP